MLLLPLSARASLPNRAVRYAHQRDFDALLAAIL
jgi:hypothetical protein